MQIPNSVSTSPRLENTLFPNDDVFSEFHGLSPDELANDDIQSTLIQSCSDNPDFFGRDITKCLRELTPYLSFPKEYEHGLTETIIETNRLDKHSYFPIAIKEPNGTEKTILAYGERTSSIPDNAIKKEIINEKGQYQVVLQYRFHHNHYISLLRKACKHHPYLFKYGFELMGMLLSWKATFDKNQGPRGSHLSDDQKEIVLKKQRTNINKYYLDYARIKIAEAWEKGESASTWIGKPLKKGISRNARTIAQTLDLPTPESIGGSALPTVLSQLPPTQKKKKKKFTKSSLTSLFQQTGDAELDNMLDTGREYVEDAAFYKPALKPGQILLRKKIEDNEFSEPYMYEFKVMKPKYLQKYFPDTNS